MSSRRAGAPLTAYSLPPERNSVRLMVTSVYSIGMAPSVLSIVRLTSARPSAWRLDVPAKMTSSILPPRRFFAPCSPMTHASASTTLDSPDPLGPTTHVMPGSSPSRVADANDLKPRIDRVLRNMSDQHSHRRGGERTSDRADAAEAAGRGVRSPLGKSRPTP